MLLRLQSQYFAARNVEPHLRGCGARKQPRENSGPKSAGQCYGPMAAQRPALDLELRRAHGMVGFPLAGSAGGGGGPDFSRAAFETTSIPQRIDQLRQLPQVWRTGGAQV